MSDKRRWTITFLATAYAIELVTVLLTGWQGMSWKAPLCTLAALVITYRPLLRWLRS